MLSDTASSAMNTFAFILENYKDEFDRARNYDPKNDKAYQREQRRLARIAAKQKSESGSLS